VVEAAGPCRDRMKEKATQSGVYAPFCEAVDALRALERPDPLVEARELISLAAASDRWKPAILALLDKAITARGGE